MKYAWVEGIGPYVLRLAIAKYPAEAALPIHGEVAKEAADFAHVQGTLFMKYRPAQSIANAINAHIDRKQAQVKSKQRNRHRPAISNCNNS